MLYRARKTPNYDAACFHTQQCVEKYLKARLDEAALPFSKTHNLPHLLTLTLSVESQWTVLQPEVTALTIFSVDFRYPGKAATKADAKTRSKIAVPCDESCASHSDCQSDLYEVR